MPAHTIASVSKRVEGILNKTVTYDNPHQADYADQLRLAVRKHNRRADGKAGDCLTVAYLLALIECKTLVHALLNPEPNCVFHAWVEFGGVCVDLTRPEPEFRYCMRREFPYKVTTYRRYRGAERLLRLCDEFGEGPWDDVFLADEAYFTRYL